MKIFDRLLKFVGNTAGNIASVTAVIMLPILGAAGLALDYANVSRIKSDMQSAADAAALAAVHIASTASEEDVQKKVEEFFAANSDVQISVARNYKVEGKVKTNTVQVTASADVELFILPVLGHEFANVSVEASSSFAQQPVEMALVIDNTRSMDWGSSWDQVANALGDVLDTIENQTALNSFHVTLVPYTDRVNISQARQSWLRHQDFLNDWKGCTEPSEINIASYPFAIDFDARPGDFVPSAARYAGGSYARGASKSQCAEAIVGPTTNIDAARNSLTRFSPLNATGRFDDALVWGWRAVTEKWRGEWSSDPNYPSRNGEKVKIVAMFTDGLTNINKYEMEEAKGEFGNNEGSVSVFSHFLRACDLIKEDGVEVFLFDTAGNPNAESYFRNCAGENYYKVENQAELLAAIRNLGTEVGNLRLIR